jgi:transcriptional regulator with XRE-family HTH domain
MRTMSPDRIPQLASTLLRLRGQTLSAVAQATGIRTANLSVWLRGKPQVISAARVTALTHHLGIEGGQLRGDVLHQWADCGQLDLLRAMCTLLEAKDSPPTWLFQDEQPGLTKTRFLQWGGAWIRLAVTPDTSGLADVAGITHAQRVVTLPCALAGISTDSVQLASNALLELAQQVAMDVGDDELLDGLLYRLNEGHAAELAFNTANPAGWVQLERALRSALSAGVSPAELAKWIASHQDALNSACGRNR